MKLISLASYSNQDDFLEKENPLAAVKERKVENSELRPGMSPKEMADVISNHLISVIRKQFEDAKNNFQQK